MLLHNITPMPAIAFRQFDLAGELECVVAARGRFSLRLDAPMTPDHGQPDLHWQDAYQGAPHSTSLLHASDLAPFRPGTDVSVLGDAYAPGGKPLASWTCGIQIPNRLDRVLRVTGPRRWVVRPSRTRIGPLRLTQDGQPSAWQVTEPDPARSVPLDWALAYGGPTLGLPDDELPPPMMPDNPLGIGVIDPARTATDRDYPAPQIEWADMPIRSFDASEPAPVPAGFGLASPWWPCRLRHAGTYDEQWLEHRHPLLPEDFDDRFWQSAPPGMVVEPWLQGDESFVLSNLHPDHPRLSGLLPRSRMVVRVHLPQAAMEDRELALDSLQFDLRPGLSECQITWRARFPLPDAQLAQLVLRETDMEYRRLRRPKLHGVAA